MTVLWLLYFVPPITGMLVRPRLAIYGRVWLFNLVSLFAWPILILLIPWRTR